MGFLKKNKPEAFIWLGCCGVFFFIPLTTLPLEVFGAVALAAWVISGNFSQDAVFLKQTKVIIPVCMLLVLPWVGLLYTPASIIDGLSVASASRLWLYALATVSVIRVQKKPDLIIKLFLSGLALNCFISTLQLSGLLPLKNGQPTGLLVGSSLHIPYTLFLTIGILISSFYVSKAAGKKESLLYLFSMLLYFTTIGYIGGRSGYIAFIVLSPLIIYNLMGQRHIIKILVVSILAVSILFAFPVVRSRFAKIKEDLQLYKQGDMDSSLGARFYMWRIALTQIKNNPVLGIGTDGFKHSTSLEKKFKAIQNIAHPHSSFLYVMVSYGLLGLTAFCWLLLVMLKRGWKGRDSPLGFAVFAFTAVFIIGSLTDTQVLTFSTAMAFSFFAAASEAIHG